MAEIEDECQGENGAEEDGGEPVPEETEVEGKRVAPLVVAVVVRMYIDTAGTERDSRSLSER